ncbi:PREDICTED: uncharacterized protein LOC109351861 isoform X2 [Lupinus angustifolius]|uniref:uncharacterized protein LOC109351861 isoform X2 n=1 Tax=Lupinus angustifolius TaxID=3871 RepID=UPI00092E2A32|nr:PREDICTED: uncharacterized protein LOC109351861 isoform X2 [Lupinus angustifolius]
MYRQRETLSEVVPNMSWNKKEREIKLVCPSLSSKVVNFIAWDEQKIDLGSIAEAFGLDPSTLKLNGYFISRGVDFISSSVTWNSLLTFFSSKALSTAKDDCDDALVVTGKLCKVGGHESRDFQNGIGKVMEGEIACSSRGTQLEAINLLKNKKPRVSNSDEILNGLSCKRKQLLEDFNQFKKLKINDDKSDIRDISSGTSRSQFTCSKNLKRIREDEAILAAHNKRIR